MSDSEQTHRTRQLRATGIGLETLTLAWNDVGVVILVLLALQSTSVALTGFALDSLIEIGASTVVIWELTGTDERRQHRALRLIAWAFIALAVYLLTQSIVALIAGDRPVPIPGGIWWTAATAAVMFALAAGKRSVGRALGNPVLLAESRVTVIDGILACAVLAGLSLNLALGWWWADSLAALVIVGYAAREAFTIFRPHHADE